MSSDIASPQSSLSPHCSRCESPLEPGDLRCAICGQSAPRSKTSEHTGVSVTLLRCQGCGAAITYDPVHRAPACSFCGDVLEIETIADPMEQTELYLPMTVTADQARAALRTWLDSRGWFKPSDLSAASQLTEMKPLWWPAWIVDVEAIVSWAADSNAGAGRSAWAPHAGQNTIQFNSILASASQGLTAAEAAAIAPGMDFASGRDEVHGGGEQPTLERFDVPRSTARQQVGAVIQQSAAARVQEQFIPGTKFRHVRVAVVPRRLVTRRYSLPAYVLAYRYRKKLYRVVICGQDARYIIGSSPFSYAKLFAVIAAGLLLALLMLFALNA